ncbi:N-acetyltransferase, partial [Brevibacillus sp. SIMBA_076]
LPSGHVRDAVVYSVIANEWPAVKERLLEKLESYKEKR